MLIFLIQANLATVWLNPLHSWHQLNADFKKIFFLLFPAGTVDSNWVVGATLEKKLVPLPLTLALGAFLNHRKNKFQCGFSVTIG